MPFNITGSAGLAVPRGQFQPAPLQRTTSARPAGATALDVRMHALSRTRKLQLQALARAEEPLGMRPVDCFVVKVKDIELSPGEDFGIVRDEDGVERLSLDVAELGKEFQVLLVNDFDLASLVFDAIRHRLLHLCHPPSAVWTHFVPLVSMHGSPRLSMIPIPGRDEDVQLTYRGKCYGYIQLHDIRGYAEMALANGDSAPLRQYVGQVYNDPTVVFERMSLYNRCLGIQADDVHMGSFNYNLLHLSYHRWRAFLEGDAEAVSEVDPTLRLFFAGAPFDLRKLLVVLQNKRELSLIINQIVAKNRDAVPLLAAPATEEDEDDLLSEGLDAFLDLDFNTPTRASPRHSVHRAMQTHADMAAARAPVPYEPRLVLVAADAFSAEDSG